MEQKTKELSYQRIYGSLKEMFGCDALSYPEDRKNYEFTCRIGNIAVEYVLFADKDLLKIKAGMRFPGYTDEQLFNLGDSLKQKSENLYFTYYDEQLFLQRAYTFVGIADKEAAEQVYKIAIAFFTFLKENADILQEAQEITEKRTHSVRNEPAEESVPNKDWMVTEPNLQPLQEEEKYEPEEIKESSESAQPPENLKELKQEPVVLEDKPDNEPDHDTVIRGTVIAETLVTDKVVVTHVEEDSIQKEKQEEKPDKKEAPEISLEDLFSGGNIPVGSSERRKKRKKVKVSKSIPETNKPAEISPGSSIPKPQIPDSFQKMYDEMDQAFESRKQQLDYRTATLDARAAKLAEQESAMEMREKELQEAMDEKYLDREIQVREREEAVDEKEKELLDFEQDLKSRREDIEALKANYQNAMISLESERRSYGLKWKQLDMEKETLQARERDLDERAALIGKIGGSSHEVRLLQQENENLKKQIDSLQNQMGNPEEVSRLKKELESNANTMDEMMNTINEYQEKIKDLEALVQAAIPSVMSPEEQAYHYQMELKEIQIDAQLVSSESDCILAGMKDDCKIVINLTVGMLYVEKALKRSFKYQKVLDDWNQEDICKSYLLSTDKLICKCVYKENLLENIVMITNQFNSLR